MMSSGESDRHPLDVFDDLLEAYFSAASSEIDDQPIEDPEGAKRGLKEELGERRAEMEASLEWFERYVRANG